ncbi:hypothetical protein MycrhDRAFT_6957 [Mycolicibacterium rhodesiae JS60]|nr:hypothetical protein MycrhDRAFT_6957 [Mycolicibacterium rhodesiae JS60]
MRGVVSVSDLALSGVNVSTELVGAGRHVFADIDEVLVCPVQCCVVLLGGFSSFTSGPVTIKDQTGSTGRDLVGFGVVAYPLRHAL